MSLEKRKKEEKKVSGELREISIKEESAEGIFPPASLRVKSCTGKPLYGTGTGLVLLLICHGNAAAVRS